MTQTSAGGVVYRKKEDGVIEVKLITTRAWKYSLPKGHVERDESLELTALREVQEESGVIAEIEEYLGETVWKLRSGDMKTVHIFLMKCIQDGEINDPDNEILNVHWKTLDEAIKLVDFLPMRKMLLKAVKSLDAEKAALCENCFNDIAIMLNWCEPCLVEAKIKLENKKIKKALKNK